MATIYDSVPTWNGDASSFEAFVLACRWYEKSLKDTERKQCASRVWQKLTGPAKSVVKHLNPDEYEGPDGLAKLIQVLRTSPLQQLPIPDTYSRLEAWHSLRRNNKETIPELIVREDDLYTQLQQSLQRARSDRLGYGGYSGSGGVGFSGASPEPPPMVDPPGTPSRSPIARAATAQRVAATRIPTTVSESPAPIPSSPLMGDFEEEMRGYRLLKAARLTTAERQHVLTQTQNDTHYHRIRLALRTLFADENEPQRGQDKRIWWAEGMEDMEWSWENDPVWEDWNYYGTWDEEVDEPNLLWNDPYGEWYDESWSTDYQEWEDEEVMVLDTTEVPEEMQYKEATVLAAEAQKTLKEAREAVRKTRAARGYYAPESASGKGISGPKSSPSSSPKGKGYGGQFKGKGYGFASKGGNKAGPCFICGKFDHGYAQCPDRFSYKGNQKGKSKKGKGGKPKGKGKSKSFFVDIHLDVLAAQWDDSALYGRSHTRAIIDTGATENAIGVNCLHDLVVSGKYSYEVCQEDLPTFRFGNGHSDKARSRVDLHGTSLGTISFYVLDGMAASTPPLIGSRTLRAKNTMLSYSNGMFIFHDDDGWRKHGRVYAIRMQALQSGHLTIDLSEEPKGWRGDIHGSVADQEVDFLEPHETTFTESSCGCNHVFMVETESMDNISSSIRSLAQRLQHLREQRQSCNEPTSSCRRRSSSPGIPMPREAHLIQPASESAFVVDHMSSMRDEIDLPCQEGNGWSISPDGATSPSHQVGVGATSKRDGSRDGDREDCEWQAHGVEGPGTSERIGQQHEHQHDVCGVLRTHGSRESLCQDEANILGEQDRASGHQQGEGPVNGCGGSTDAKRQGTVDQGGEEGDGPDKGGNCPDGVGVDLRRRGSPGEEWQGQGLLKEPMMQLWSSLERLRSKMTAQPHVDTTRDGLEVVTTSRSQQQPECSSTTKSHVISKHGDYDGGTSLVHETSNLEERHRDFLNERNPANTISPTTARKISTSMAALGVMLMAPVAGLFSQISGCPDFAEVACSPNSSLCNEMERLGYSIKRYNFKSGYDLERPLGTKLLNQDLRAHPPRSLWISLACTRLSALQNLTDRDAEEWARFEKRQMQDLRRAEDVADGVLTVVENGGTFCWEWPTTATKGWNAKCIKKILKGLRRLNQPAYWCKLDGCAYGLEYQGYPVKKSWTILTNNKNVWLSLQKRCPGHQDHLHCRGTVAQASLYYPWKMVQAATKAIVASWKSVEDNVGTSLSKDVEAYLLDIHEAREEEPFVEQLRWEDPSILALTRNRFPEKPPVGRQLENIRQQMMRIHRASGHASFSNLQRLLRARKAPQWSIDMAGRLTCPECVESRKPKPQPPSSMHPMPGLFEIVGTDIFEFEHGDRKHKLILWRDRASGLVMVDELQIYGGPDDEVKHWEPKTKDVLRSFSRWLMHNPCPAWVISDPATYFTSEEFLEFMGRSGIGVLTIPAESHWMLGGEEGAISVLKMAVKRLLKEEADLNIDQAFQLAAHGHNQTIGSTGYSPFQWTRGSSCPQGQLPAGIDPSKAFHGALKLKEKARVAFEAENAKYKLSKLNNAKTRPASTFQPGTLLMLWRQRVRPGKVGGQWTGPVRALIQEGNTVWVATGATIIKARTTQLRACTQREQMQAMLEGTAVYKTPVTLETLLQSFTGKHFLNVTGENPSLQQMQDDVQGAEVSLPAQSSQRSDTWKMTVEEGKKWLVRVHNLPRLALFDPQKLSTCPMSLDELTGRRMTIIKPLHQGAVETTRLEDDFLTSDDPGRALQERWIGETRLEVKPSGDEEGRPTKQRRKEVNRGKKRASTPDAESSSQKKEKTAEDVEIGDDVELKVLPDVPEIHPLTTALREKGADAVDGVPAVPRQPPANESGCPVADCVLPGGHGGAHEDEHHKKFTWTPYGGRVNLEETSSESSSPSEDGDSESSEELKADVEKAGDEQRVEEDFFVALEIDVSEEDFHWLENHPRKATAWLSKKMESKSKEMSWSKMSLEEKKNFDMAQAKELNNVLQSKALRCLTDQELADLDKKKIMGMRWVLTTADKSSKARLVILGFQAWNLVEVQSSAPTLSRLSRNMLLTTCANCGFFLRSGDVTSAFLQTDWDMNEEELYVWAPSELAVLYGANPSKPIMPLKVIKAFYGLSHAPRKWYEQVVKTLEQQGWKRLTADKCLFTLMQGNQLIGVCGIHVDDFLLAGNEKIEVYQEARKKLEASFRWGRWDEGSFTFAGCQISQSADMSIRISQEDYSENFLEEIDIPQHRKDNPKSPATPSEISKLRGVIGTVAWRASQTAPHYQADAGLMLSEIPHATVSTLLRANKLVREMRRESSQSLLFPAWSMDWRQITTIVWADASQKNRWDSSSTMGIVAGLAPSTILSGEEVQVAIVQWRSSKTPRQCLGSNGAEVQAITEGEDTCFRVRALWAEIHGVVPDRYSLYEQIKEYTTGGLVMDSRGIYDSITRNTSALHGLRSSRAGYELTLSIAQALKIDTMMRWVNGTEQLADSLTKASSRRVMHQFLAGSQYWKLVFDEKFTAGRKIKKRDLLEKLRSAEVSFVSLVRKLAVENRWPTDHLSLRSMGDESCRHSPEVVPPWFDET